MINYADRLRATPLGADLAEHCNALAGLMEPVQVPAEEALFEATTPPEALFVVIHGGLKVMLRSQEQQEDLTIALLGPGGVVGELEVFTQSPHMASVVATEDTTCLKLPMEVIRNPPAEQREAISAFVFVIARVLAMRLAAVNSKLMAAWNLPEAGAINADMSAPALREVLDDIWQW